MPKSKKEQNRQCFPKQSVDIPTWYYQQFDANFTNSVPEEGFGGWKKATIKFPRNRIAVVVMHAWDVGTFQKYPGWWRCAPGAARTVKISDEIIAPMLKELRQMNFTVIHIAGGSNGYWKKYPGYSKTCDLYLNETLPQEQMPLDELTKEIYKFRDKNVFVGEHNLKDVNEGFANLDFYEPLKPADNEYVCENSDQLFAVCKAENINHLVYTGFMINWCLLLSPGGMIDMLKHGIMCSTIRQATTAVENKETASKELAKEIAMWKVSLAFGFVFDLDDFIDALR